MKNKNIKGLTAKSKKIRCLTALALSVLMAFSMTACGQQNTNSSGLTESSSEKLEETASQTASVSQTDGASQTETSSQTASASQADGASQTETSSQTDGASQTDATSESTSDDSASDKISSDKNTSAASTSEGGTGDAADASYENTQYDETADIEAELEYVAELNDCEVDDLIINFDDYGYVNFLGNGYTKEKINSAEDALESISALAEMAGLDGCSFTYYREDVSPVSGYTYYTFSQIASGETDDTPVTFSYAQIRIIADADGNSAGFSADIALPSEIVPVSADNMVEQAEAEETVKKELDADSRIIDEMTEFSYWDDEHAAKYTSTGKMIPAWLIYTTQSTEGMPYTLYVVSAQRDYFGSAVISDKIALKSLNVESNEYTSNVFFEGMEDGGTYTYHVDMTWAYEANTGYQAAQEMDITVPVMYDPETGLYYLADYNEKLAAANYYDFYTNNEVNALVSDDPEDINSWHFASMTGPEGQTYFCDVNYAISSFDAMLKTYNIYKERYGYNSVDNSGLPILFLLNECESGSYPSDPSGFAVNALNMGQWHDWAVFASSQTFSGSAEVATMAHEFAHGINSQLTSSHYLNEMGAVMEGYADSIGDNLALLYGYKDPAYADVVGSEYAEPIRSFSNPYDYGGAKYINGMYYVNPVHEYAASGYDEGGVHTNSSVVNYLCYCLSHNDDSNAAVIDLGKNVDMFIETLYCANYDTGYDELGAYLLYAADFVGLTDEELQYVYDTVASLGFYGDDSELSSKIAEDGGYTYSVTLQCEEDMSSTAVFEALLYDTATDKYHLMGGMDENESVSLVLPDDMQFNTYVHVTMLTNGLTVGTFLTDTVTADADITFPLTYYQAEIGETISLTGTLSYITKYSYETYSYDSMDFDIDQTELTFDEEGYYCITLYDEEGSDHFVLVEVD